jgi:Met-zincin
MRLPLYLFLSLFTFACSADDTPMPANPLQSGADFVAIPKHLAPARIEARNAARAARALPPSDNEEDFYIAVKRSQLTNRWFLSAYLEQYFPGAVSFGAARSLGTRVVTFRIQNGKLFVFDAGDGKASTELFDPELLIEAYPLVEDPDFDCLAHADEYVLFDPAAGLNRFGVVSDWLASDSWSGATHFQVELAFLQHFRSLADGVVFEEVFTGYADSALHANDPLWVNAFRGSGTLSLALRKYVAHPDFQRFPAPETPYYFLDEPHLDPATNKVGQVAIKWNIKPGMRPIKWLISPKVGEYVAAHPELQGADIVGSLQRGIESWNEVFGFPVFKAVVAAPETHFGDDDKNYVIFDPGPGPGYAYANWRTNPNTGEIRGADVYFGREWLDVSSFHDDPPTSGASPPAGPAPELPALVWQGVGQQPLCVRFAGEGRGPGGDQDDQLTVKQKLEFYIEQMIVHEIGHTLGLRHNFKGTLTPPTGSVMDYMYQEDRLAQHRPGPFDIAAVRWLYGLSSDPPTQPFCNDDMVGKDPECRKFDRGADPANHFFKDLYASMRGWMFNLNFFSDDWFDWYSEGLLGFVRAGSGDAPLRAYALLTEGARPPISAAQAADPRYAKAADYISYATLRYLFSPQLSKYAQVKSLPTHAALLTAVLADERGILLNLDGVRGFPARRLCVDLLKQQQKIEAYQALLEARDALTAQLASGTLTGAPRALSEDLLARVSNAISPYFE